MIEQMTETFGVVNCEPARTPLPEPLVLSINMARSMRGRNRKCPAHSTVNWLDVFCIGNITRPEIVFSAGYLSRFMSNPGTAHWKADKHAMRYLKSTSDLRIVYGILFQIVFSIGVFLSY